MTPTFRTSRPVSAADPSKPHLILVGLPGSGKTTVGQAVADLTSRTFLDLDQEIERREGRSIGRIFAEKGEAYFRKKERELTEELTFVGNMIVAPGGGWAVQSDVVAIVRDVVTLETLGEGEVDWRCEVTGIIPPALARGPASAIRGDP